MLEFDITADRAEDREQHQRGGEGGCLAVLAGPGDAMLGERNKLIRLLQLLLGCVVHEFRP